MKSKVIHRRYSFTCLKLTCSLLACMVWIALIALRVYKYLTSHFAVFFNARFYCSFEFTCIFKMTMRTTNFIYRILFVTFKCFLWCFTKWPFIVTIRYGSFSCDFHHIGLMRNFVSEVCFFDQFSDFWIQWILMYWFGLQSTVLFSWSSLFSSITVFYN